MILSDIPRGMLRNCFVHHCMRHRQANFILNWPRLLRAWYVYYKSDPATVKFGKSVKLNVNACSAHSFFVPIFVYYYTTFFICNLKRFMSGSIFNSWSIIVLNGNFFLTNLKRSMSIIHCSKNLLKCISALPKLSASSGTFIFVLIIFANSLKW